MSSNEVLQSGPALDSLHAAEVLTAALSVPLQKHPSKGPSPPTSPPSLSGWGRRNYWAHPGTSGHTSAMPEAIPASQNTVHKANQVLSTVSEVPFPKFIEIPLEERVMPWVTSSSQRMPLPNFASFLNIAFKVSCYRQLFSNLILQPILPETSSCLKRACSNISAGATTFHVREPCSKGDKPLAFIPLSPQSDVREKFFFLTCIML